MAACDAIKLELPVDVKTFKFTFECRTPGPITIEISIQKPLQMLSPQAGTVKGPDISGIHTEVPGALSNWLGAVEAGPPPEDIQHAESLQLGRDTVEHPAGATERIQAQAT
ncbi:uncharacterized protein F5891DRAFT_1179948 [Suillus fuscotomentosus]|uniref:Uncharacterized protein n=1 Tax=Suillus fuscotomentosus TaxID=1912939 RepID=A0AAD4HTY1_9AGAM|nr:uncharacterized protein F5891DRAFT_1179948 [Suillus fuscotomentosus]KAG1908427.1 hypothetical protein F5891DRAFT_1179948 [Suillus fuscotomentosus]